ncbi:hypothetical protein OX283_001665 [Flavobacterium sp. SUN052]|uniref:hypothetical protein n=1 Tax=Flavobacterium sp. SUN052 TaxID=3002441 RepID=UPI00237DC26C|nr:hypothetical protein [Flavobacterium sp. SUN052]MEC4003350.1 hypothetical protein [Flavobacterium sp. SUN052]
MIQEITFPYKPSDHESEKASNSYLMSLVALVVGLPLPIINLLATFFFFLGNRKGTYFVRWHCMQALVSQAALLCMNSFGFWWTISIIFGDEHVSNRYFAYIFTALLFNITEFVSTIYCAVQTRKGKHVQQWFFGNITNLICKPNDK